jgi:hypothetical protein
MTTGNSLNGSNSQQRLSDQISAITLYPTVAVPLPLVAIDRASGSLSETC